MVLSSCSILLLAEAKLTLMVVSSLILVPASSTICSADLLPRRACKESVTHAFGGIWTYRFVVAPDLLDFSGEGLDLPLRDAELVQGDLELPLDLVVVGGEFGELQGLLLDGLLQVDVGLVGRIQGHLQLGDLDLELLLDAGDLGLETGLGLDDAGVKLFDLDAGGLAANRHNCNR
jgi:hypothetical protein